MFPKSVVKSQPEGVLGDWAFKVVTGEMGSLGWAPSQFRVVARRGRGGPVCAEHCHGHAEWGGLDLPCGRRTREETHSCGLSPSVSGAVTAA